MARYLQLMLLKPAAKAHVDTILTTDGLNALGRYYGAIARARFAHHATVILFYPGFGVQNCFDKNRLTLMGLGN